MKTKNITLFEAFSKISLETKALENILVLINLEIPLSRVCRISHLVHMKSSPIEKEFEVLHD